MTRAPKIAAALLLSALAGCTNADQGILLSSKSAVELRAMQSRSYATSDRDATMRGVIGTLQDLGYNIDSVEGTVGTVTATKLAVLRLSISTYPHGAVQLVVRANAIVNFQNRFTQVDDPVFYQTRIFEPLSHTLALQSADAPSDDASPAPNVLPITPGSVKPATTPVAQKG